MSPSSLVTETPLLAALRRLPTGSLYTLGDKGQVMAALQLCRGNAVRPPQWGFERSVLTVEVVSNRVWEVTLELRDGRLTARCDCQRSSSAKTCAHALAVLFILKMVLSPSSAPGFLTVAKDFEAMRVALLEPPPIRRRPGEKKKKAPRKPPATFAVVLEERNGAPFIEVTRGGIPVTPIQRGIPAPLLPVVPKPWDHRSSPKAALCTLLDKGPFRWPLLLREGEGMVELTVEPPVVRTGRLCFDVLKDGVLASRVLDNGSVLGGRLLWLDSWVADTGHRRLLRLSMPRSWSTWDKLVKGAAPADGVGRLALEEFPGLEMRIDDGDVPPLGDFLLRIEGKKAPVTPARHNDYHLHADIDRLDGMVGLHCRLRSGDRLQLLDAQALSLFAEEVFQEASAPLRAFKRRRILYEAFLSARKISARTQRTDMVREALKIEDFQGDVRREALELLEELFDFDEMSTWNLTFFDGRWHLLQRDRDREALLIEILFRHFGEPAFRQAQRPGQILVPNEVFFNQLPEFFAELRRLGIELLCDERPLEKTTLDITVHSGTSDIDWFELRPEIRCNGAALDAGVWRRALEQGMIESGGKLHILDSSDRRALAILAGMSPSSPNPSEVVRIPRLHILDLLALRRLGATLQLASEDERILHNLENFDSLPERTLPQLNAVPRDYQRLGYQWLAFLYEHKFGACLADDMGLGKTLQAITLLTALNQKVIASNTPSGTPHLVVVPPSLIFNWESEIARFAPALRTRVYRGQERSTDFTGADVILTSYELVRRDIDKLADIPFHVIVFDEAQAVKNVHAAVTGAVRRLQGVFKLALTGTPVENHLGEYWSIIDLVLPGLLGEYRGFGGARAEVSPAVIEHLIARTRPFMLRRTKEKIAAELPHKVEMDLHLELTEVQKTLYQQTVREIRREVGAAYAQKNTAQARITALAALMRLRRLCLDPRLVTKAGGDAAPSPKIEALCEHLEELRDEGHSALVFSQFTSFLDLVEPALTECGIPFLRLDGATPVGQRKKIVEQFQGSAEPLIFLLSLKAGGRGLNLTRASYVIHLDPWWNPAVENQASDRAHRIGQTQKVTVLRLLMRHTVEEKMMVLKARKERLYKALLEGGKSGGGVPLTREDFEFLVGDEGG